MRTIEVDDARVAYLDTGDGEPVVLLHSSASNSGQWRDLGTRIGDRYRVVAPDLYGYGGTDAWSGRGPLALADEARLVAAVTDRIEGPFHLVGHSYGAAVALRVALESRHRLRTLTLIEPIALHLLRNRGTRERALFSEVAGIAAVVNEAAVSGDYWGGMERFVDYWNGPGTWRGLAAKTQMALARCTAKVLLDFWSTMSERTPLEGYGAIQVPTLVLYGDRTPATTRRVAELLSENIPEAELAMITEAGHMLPLTHAELVGELIAGHLEASPIEGTSDVVAEASAFAPEFELLRGRQF